MSDEKCNPETREEVMHYYDAIARQIAAALDLLAVARGYEKWEADMILDQEAWRGDAELPTLTWPLWDRLTELQKLRNEAINKAEGR